jgi:hypothetical protein
MKNQWHEMDLKLINDLRAKKLTWIEISTNFPGSTPNAVRKAYNRSNQKNEVRTPVPTYLPDKTVYNSILVISDMHHPYNHPDTVKFLEALSKKYKFDKIICIGDEVDYHALSFHDSDPDLPSAGDELNNAIESLKPLYKMFPKMDIVESNHGSMVLRKGLANGMPKAVLKPYNEILGAPKGWNWKFDIKVQTPLGAVYFCHGKSGSAGRLASQYGMSCVQGHFHEKSQITYISTPEKLMFDAHTGCLADDKSLALGYNKINPRRPIVSLLVIVNGIPQIVPMVLNTNGRWIGKL